MTLSNRSCAIGLDVGGTKIAAGLVLPSGETLDRTVVETRPERGGKAVLDDALKLAERLLEIARSSELTVMGIGVGVAKPTGVHGHADQECLTGVFVDRPFHRPRPFVEDQAA